MVWIWLLGGKDGDHLVAEMEIRLLGGGDEEFWGCWLVRVAGLGVDG